MSGLAVSPVLTSDTILVDVQLFGHPFSFLIDTGAAVSLIHLNTWKRCASSDILLQPSPRQLVSVTGAPLQVLGTARVALHIQNTPLECDLLVVDGLTTDGILGLDFLRRHQCVIDFQLKTLNFTGTPISIPLAPIPVLAAHVSVNAVATVTTTIPAYTEQLITLTANTERSGTWLLEQNLPRSSRLQVARAIVDSEINIVTSVINVTNEPLTLRQGSLVAKLQCIKDDDIQVAAAISDCEPITEHKKQLLWGLVLKTEGLSDKERDTLFSLLLSYEDIFASDSSDLGQTGAVRHTINTGIATPIRQQPRRLPPHYRKEAKRLLDEMLHRNIIQRSASPWASPIVLVKKKDGSFRFCVDYRKVNNVTKKDAYPLPHVNDTLDTLAGSEWFTTLDLLCGYWQVQMEESDREKTAFITQEGLFEFQVMPFGLSNAPATFQRLMDLILAGLQWSHCLVYLDDVIILGKTFHDHLSHLEIVFQRLRQAGLKIKPQKCALMKREVSFLGHIVSRAGIAADPSKTDKVVHWPTPTNRRQVQQFLGLANYYRRFVAHFATLVKPLHCLTEKNARFKWTDACQEAFDAIRQQLSSPPLLSFPDFSRPFIVDTDASDVGIGSVLSQIQEDGAEHVIAYASRVLTKAERQYSVTRRELLAVIYSLDHFRQYLLGRPFLLRSDHGSLKWLQSFRNPEGQLARWLEKLQEYSFTIEHRPGTKHLNADALSRLLETSASSEDDTGDNAIHGVFRDYDDNQLRKLQLQDPDLRLVLQAKEDNVRPSRDDVRNESLKTRKLIQVWDQLEVAGGVLMRKFCDETHNRSFLQLVVPRVLQESVLEELHAGDTGGHLGVDKTVHKLKQRFYWPGHFRDVENWCKTCHSCVTRKTPAPKSRGALSGIPSGSPMQLISVDIVGPFPESNDGNKYILVVVDQFTKWSEAYPIPNQEATTVADVLTREWFFRFSSPECLHSDQGRQFESQLIRELCTILGIRKSRTTPYHPQGDGTAERFNRTLLTMLATSAKNNAANWQMFIRPVCLAYNSSVHASTGFTPFYMMFGREARLPIDLRFGTGDTSTLSPNEYVRHLQKVLEYAFDTAREHLGDTQRRQKALYDQKIHGKPFSAGDQVWLHSTVVPKESHKKLYHPWVGPYVVLDKLSDITYKIKPVTGSDRTSVVHFDRLKLCLPGTRFPSSTHDTPMISSLPPDNVGDGAVLIDCEDDLDEEDAPPPLSREPSPEADASPPLSREPSPEADTSPPLSREPSPPPPPRYPSRVRREPTRFQPFVRY